MEAKKKITLFFISTLLFFNAAALSVFSAETEEKIPVEYIHFQSPPAPSTEYRLAKNDKLLIAVWGDEELTTDTIVGPDGKISFPLIGTIQAAGLTVDQLDNEITEKLKKYIRQPEVSVIIKEFAGKRVAILGEIVSPGIYKLDRQDRVLELIALAGGFTSDAVLRRVIIIRRSPEPVIILVNLNKAILQADPSQDIVLEPTDIVYISKKFVANFKYLWETFIGPPADKGINIQTMTKGKW